MYEGLFELKDRKETLGDRGLIHANALAMGWWSKEIGTPAATPIRAGHPTRSFPLMLPSAWGDAQR